MALHLTRARQKHEFLFRHNLVSCRVFLLCCVPTHLHSSGYFIKSYFQVKTLKLNGTKLFHGIRLSEMNTRFYTRCGTGKINSVTIVEKKIQSFLH